LHAEVAHHPLAPLRWARGEGWLRDSLALLSRKPDPALALVLVHGWGGAARSTWERFPQFIDDLPVAATIDAFFLDYRSTTHTVAWCAGMLREFLGDLATAPTASFINGSLPAGALPRDTAARYARVVVVAHSMGAVISRRALLDLGIGDDALRRFSLLYFAPAHAGADVAQLIGSGLGLDGIPGARLVGAAARAWLRSLGDLEPRSDALLKLAADTRSAHEARRPDGAPHLRAVVLHGGDDHVVRQDDFEGDPPFIPVMGRNHRTICKPADHYRIPADALARLLGAPAPGETA
jgi:alpha-beta hydrolase superfamily lysophospholipase